MNYCWTNGTKKFLGHFGTKYGLAWDLLVMRDIRLTPKDKENFKITDVRLITAFKAAKILEHKGYWWEKCQSSDQSVSAS